MDDAISLGKASCGKDTKSDFVKRTPKPHVSFRDFYNDALNDLASDPQMVLIITDFKAWRSKRRERAKNKRNRARANSSGGGGDDGTNVNNTDGENNSKSAAVKEEEEESSQRWAREAM